LVEVSSIGSPQIRLAARIDLYALTGDREFVDACINDADCLHTWFESRSEEERLNEPIRRRYFTELVEELRRLGIKLSFDGLCLINYKGFWYYAGDLPSDLLEKEGD